MLINWLIFSLLPASTLSGRHMEQLFEDLLYYYQKSVRPSKAATGPLTVRFGSSLIRIIDVNEISQMIKTNLWLQMQWYDHRLKWEPSKYDGIMKIVVPPHLIWLPDIALYNSADGYYEIASQQMASVYYNGLVDWRPPQVFTSSCKIDIRYFPYDEQKCMMKFGAWSNNGFFMDLIQIPVDERDIIQFTSTDTVGNLGHVSAKGMDLSNFIKSHSWALVNLSSARHEQFYYGCCGQEFYIDVTFYLTLRRKPLFYTCYLMVPSMLVAFLTTFVFYIPSKDHKITFAISILLQQTVFYIIMLDLLPPSSMDLPLFGAYLMFTIILVTISIFVSVITINLYRRNGASPQMCASWRFWFLYLLPRALFLKPWQETMDYCVDDDGVCGGVSRSNSNLTDLGIGSFGQQPEVKLSFGRSNRWSNKLNRHYKITTKATRPTRQDIFTVGGCLRETARRTGGSARTIRRMIRNVNYIADYYWRMEEEQKIADEWAYVAMVIDRCFMVVFSVVNVLGTIVICAQAPQLYDRRPELPLMDSDDQPLVFRDHVTVDNMTEYS